LTVIAEKLSAVLSEIELENQPRVDGLIYQLFISDPLSLIQIFGKLTKQLFPMNVIKLLLKKQAKLIILNS